ncbi:2'-5' RNA ligase family protein [Ureibacillus acetophenoni]
MNQSFLINRWVHPEDYHITLAFLGFAPKEMLEKAIIGVGISKGQSLFTVILVLAIMMLLRQLLRFLKLH